MKSNGRGHGRRLATQQSVNAVVKSICDVMLLFFTRGGPTERVWYYDLADVKVGKKNRVFSRIMRTASGAGP